MLRTNSASAGTPGMTTTKCFQSVGGLTPTRCCHGFCVAGNMSGLPSASVRGSFPKRAPLTLPRSENKERSCGASPSPATGRYDRLGNWRRFCGWSHRWLSSHFHKLLLRILTKRDSPQCVQVDFMRTFLFSSCASSWAKLSPSIVYSTLSRGERQDNHT